MEKSPEYDSKERVSGLIDIKQVPNLRSLDTIPALKQEITATRAVSELRGQLHGTQNQFLLQKVLPVLASIDSTDAEEGVLTVRDQFVAEVVETDRHKHPRALAAQRFRTAIQDHIAKYGTSSVLAFDELEDMQRSFTIGDTPFEATTFLAADPVTRRSTEYSVDQRKLKQAINKWLKDWNASEGSLRELAVLHIQFQRIGNLIAGGNWFGNVLDQLYLLTRGHVPTPVLGVGWFLKSSPSKYAHFLYEDFDWDEYFEFYLSAVESSARASKAVIHDTETLRAELDIQVKQATPKIYTDKLVDLLLEQPICKSQHIEERFGLERKAASRHLVALESVGILKSQKIGRETLYENFRYIELLQRLRGGWQ